MTLETTVKEFNLSREHAEDFGRHLAEKIFTGPYHAIRELVNNSHDADATRVNITYDAEEGTLIIEDNGKGMKRGGGT